MGLPSDHRDSSLVCCAQEDEWGKLSLTIKHLKGNQLSLSVQAEENVLLKLRINKALLQRRHPPKQSKRVNEDGTSVIRLSGSKKNRNRNRNRKKKSEESRSKFNEHFHKSFPKSNARQRWHHAVQDTSFSSSMPLDASVEVHRTKTNHQSIAHPEDADMFTTPKGQRNSFASQHNLKRREPTSDTSLSVSDLMSPAWLKRRQKFMAYQKKTPIGAGGASLNPSQRESKITLDGFLGAAANSNSNINKPVTDDAASYFSSPRSIQKKRLKEKKRRLERQHSHQTIEPKRSVREPVCNDSATSGIGRQENHTNIAVQNKSLVRKEEEEANTPILPEYQKDNERLLQQWSETKNAFKKEDIKALRSTSSTATKTLKEGSWISSLCDLFRKSKVP